MEEKKIKVEELSVGDWIYVQFTDGDKWSGRIVSSSDTGRMRVLCSNTKVVGCTIHFICPIPITAEALEKNGFVADKYSNKIYQYKQKDFKVMYFFENKALYLNSSNFTINAYIKHIHELQHFLRMIKVEIEL